VSDPPNALSEPPRWRRGAFPRSDLRDALLDGHIAGDVTTRSDKIREKIDRLVGGTVGERFGLSQLGGVDVREATEAVEAEAGKHWADRGPHVDVDRLLERLNSAGTRLGIAAKEGQAVRFATGHPAGLLGLFIALADLAEASGATILGLGREIRWERSSPASRSPMEFAKRAARVSLERLRDESLHREIRHIGGVAFVTDGRSALHSHESVGMQRMLEFGHPDLVVADHGFAGAALDAGIDTIAIADVNDPALLVAAARGRVQHLIVMEDNAMPDRYWPCFQAMASAFGEAQSPGPRGP
jgi:hypothetical protein